MVLVSTNVCCLVTLLLIAVRPWCLNPWWPQPQVYCVPGLLCPMLSAVSVASQTWGQYHGGQWPSSDDSLHSPAVIPPLALGKPSIMKHYHCQRTTMWGMTACLPTMVTLHDTQFVECRWWMTVGLWKLLSLDGRQPSWYQTLFCPRGRGHDTLQGSHTNVMSSGNM